MVDRSVNIRITADAGPFNRELAKAAAAAKAFSNSLNDIHVGDGDTSSLSSELKKAEQSAGSLQKAIDRDGVAIDKVHGKAIEMNKAFDRANFDRFASSLTKAEKAAASLQKTQFKTFAADLRNAEKSAAGMAVSIEKAHGQAIEMNKKFDASAASARKLGAAVDDVFDDGDGGGSSIRRFLDDLDSSGGRMEFLVQSALALGPALVPIGGAATAALAGFGAAATAAASGVAVAVLAFQGVFSALGAVNDFSLDPTIANMQKLQVAMDQLAPAGQEFVTFLQDLRPQIQDLQADAQTAFFPGLQDGLTSLMENMPIAEEFVTNFGAAMGNLAADAGDRLNDPWWQDFFEFTATEGPRALTTFSKAVGNVVEGLAGMAMAFNPMATSFNNALLSMTERFANWGRTLADNDSFQGFADFVADTGPEVWETLGEIADALVAVVQAAAPIGAISLPIIGALADTIGAIADSPVGPVLIGIAAGLSAISRAMAIGSLANGSIIGKGIASIASSVKNLGAASFAMTGFGKSVGFANIQLAKAAPAMQNFGDLVRFVGTPLLAAPTAFGRFKSAVAGVGPGAAAAAGGLLAMGASASGVDTNMGVLQATLAGGLFGGSLGAAGGNPLTIAIGATAGAFTGLGIALLNAESDIDTSISAIHDTIEQTPADFQNIFSAIEKTRAQIAETISAPIEAGTLQGVGVGGAHQAIVNAQAEEATEDLNAEEQAALDAAQAVSDLQVALGGNAIAVDTTAKSAASLTRAVAEMRPIFESAGVSFDAILAGDIGIDEAVTEVERFNAAADSLGGRTRAVGDAFAALQGTFTSTSASASTLSTALDTLLSPDLNAEAALDTFKSNLQGLSGELSKIKEAGDKDPFDGYTKGALEARAASRDVVSNFIAVAGAQAEAGAGSAHLAELLAHTREQFIAEGHAAGISIPIMKARANAIGLTPKLVSTVFKSVGLDASAVKARDLTQEYNKLSKPVRIAISEIGGQVTGAKLRALRVDGEKLSGKQIKMILAAQDNASVKFDGVRAKAKALEGEDPKVKITAQDTASKILQAVQRLCRVIGALNPRPTIDANGAPALNVMRVVQNVLDDYDGTNASATLDADDQATGIIQGAIGIANSFAGTYTATLITNRIDGGATTNSLGLGHSATGGRIRGPGTGTSDSIPTMLSDGEFVINAASTRRHLSLLHQINAERFAAGGRVGYAKGGHVGPDGADDGPSISHILAGLFHAFNVNEKASLSEAKSEVQTLLSGLKEEFGPDSHIVARVTHLTDQLLAEVKSRDKLVKATEEQTQELKDLKQAQRDYIKTVQQNFQTDPFAENNTLAGVIRSLKNDEKNAEHVEDLSRRAKRLGLSGKAFKQLVASGNVGVLEDLNTRREAKLLEKALRQRDAAASSLGQFAGNTVYSKAIQEQTHHVAHMTKRIDHMSHQIDKLEGHIEHGVRKGAHDGTKDGNKDRHRQARVAANYAGMTR